MNIKAEFTEIVSYTRNLHFVEEPDYKYMKNIIKNVMRKYEYASDFKFDWLINTNRNVVKSKN
jgi:hypothetical protein